MCPLSEGVVGGAIDAADCRRGANGSVSSDGPGADWIREKNGLVIGMSLCLSSYEWVWVGEERAWGLPFGVVRRVGQGARQLRWWLWRVCKSIHAMVLASRRSRALGMSHGGRCDVPDCGGVCERKTPADIRRVQPVCGAECECVVKSGEKGAVWWGGGGLQTRVALFDAPNKHATTPPYGLSPFLLPWSTTRAPLGAPV